MVRLVEALVQVPLGAEVLSAQQGKTKELPVSLSWGQMITKGLLLLTFTIRKLVLAAMSLKPLSLRASAGRSPQYPPRKKLWTSTGRVPRCSRTHVLCVTSL